MTTRAAAPTKHAPVASRHEPPAPPHTLPPPVVAHRLAMIVVAVVAAIGVLLSASNRLYDPDLWQHLAVGKVIWEQHRVPAEHLWSWPQYGNPDVLPSWLFRAVLWPFWSAGEVEGYFALRWILALAAFGVVWATARALGARGLAVFPVLVLCSVVYRGRSQRPEALAAVFLALIVWILESRRHGGKDRTA